MERSGRPSGGPTSLISRGLCGVLHSGLRTGAVDINHSSKLRGKEGPMGGGARAGELVRPPCGLAHRAGGAEGTMDKTVRMEID